MLSKALSWKLKFTRPKCKPAKTRSRGTSIGRRACFETMASAQAKKSDWSNTPTSRWALKGDGTTLRASKSNNSPAA